MLVATVSEIPGKRIAEVIGMVRGSTVRARHVGHDFLANAVAGDYCYFDCAHFVFWLTKKGPSKEPLP